MESVHQYEHILPRLLDVGEVIYPPGSTFGPRIQPFLQFVLVHSGEVTVWIDDVKQVVPANFLFVLYPGHQERFVFAETCETEHSWVHLDCAALSPAFLARLQRLEWPLPLSPTMRQYMHDALALKKSAFPTVSELLNALGLQMLWRYIGEGEQLRVQKSTLSHAAVEQALAFMYTHISEPLTLKLIADAVAISPAHLIRLFQTQLQTTPMAYLWAQRVALGIKLLEQTGLTVGMIAERCGFQSRFHFSRRVRQTIGYTPMEVRHRSWQQEILS